RTSGLTTSSSSTPMASSHSHADRSTCRQRCDQDSAARASARALPMAGTTVLHPEGVAELLLDLRDADGDLFLGRPDHLDLFQRLFLASPVGVRVVPHRSGLLL